MTTADKTIARFSGLIVARRAGWLTLWAGATAVAGFEIVAHASGNGSTLDVVALVVVAIATFILPDLTFLVGVGQPTRHGYLPVRAVPFYNTLHRLWPPLLVTMSAGVGLAALGGASVVLLVAGLSWMAHVALDRAAGYGLRNADGSR